MTRFRLRESRHPEEEAAYYARTYPEGYRHDRWPDHVERVAVSVDMIQEYLGGIVSSVADLSCGDAEIVRKLSARCALSTVYLSDLNGVPAERAAEVRASALETFPGALPESLVQVPGPVDLFVLSETLEHLDDPDELLWRLTGVSRYLFVSTPVSEEVTSGNLEHYWSWGIDDVHDMLRAAGWEPLNQRTLRPESTRSMPGAYRYQLWLAVQR